MVRTRPSIRLRVTHTNLTHHTYKSRIVYSHLYTRFFNVHLITTFLIIIRHNFFLSISTPAWLRVMPLPPCIFEFLSVGKVSASFVQKCAQNFNICAQFLFQILERLVGEGALEKWHFSS